MPKSPSAKWDYPPTGETNRGIVKPFVLVIARDTAHAAQLKTMMESDGFLDGRYKDKSNMAKYLFGGFQRCLYPVQKFDSEAERILAVILERESEKWFNPAKGQFQIFYKLGAEHPEYQPDFVAETADAIYMLEPKKRSAMEDADVLAKKEAAEKWCKNASNHTKKHGGKPWNYRLIPHDAISENMSISHLGGG